MKDKTMLVSARLPKIALAKALRSLRDRGCFPTTISGLLKLSLLDYVRGEEEISEELAVAELGSLEGLALPELPLRKEDLGSLAEKALGAWKGARDVAVDLDSIDSGVDSLG